MARKRKTKGIKKYELPEYNLKLEEQLRFNRIVEYESEHKFRLSPKQPQNTIELQESENKLEPKYEIKLKKNIYFFLVYMACLIEFNLSKIGFKHDKPLKADPKRNFNQLYINKFRIGYYKYEKQNYGIKITLRFKQKMHKDLKKKALAFVNDLKNLEAMLEEDTHKPKVDEKQSFFHNV